MPIQEIMVASYTLEGAPPTPVAAIAPGPAYTFTLGPRPSLDADPDDFAVESGGEDAVAGIVIAATTDNNRSDTDDGASGDSSAAAFAAASSLRSRLQF